MKTFKQFKAQLNEAKSGTDFNYKDTIKDLGNKPSVGKAASNGKVEALTSTAKFDTEGGPVPVLKYFERRQRTRIQDVKVKKGQTVIYYEYDGRFEDEALDGKFRNFVMGYDGTSFWMASIFDFDEKIGTK